MENSTTSEYSKIVHITPELAAEWLANKKLNRNLGKETIKGMVNDILNDNWRLNGETIVIDSNGQLVDGQHRLTAVIRAKKAIDSWVIFNVTPNQTDLYDRGRNRNTTDILLIKGLSKWQANSMIANTIRMHFDEQGFGRSPSDETIAQFIIKYQDTLKVIYDNVKKGCSDGKCFAKKKGIMYACFSALICGVTAEDVTKFMRILNSGIIESEEDKTIIRFRDFIKDNHSTVGRTGDKELLKRAETALYFMVNKRKPKASFVDLNSTGMDNYYSKNEILKDIKV